MASKFSEKFQLASANRDTVETLRLIEEFKAELKAHPATVAEAMSALEDAAKGLESSEARFAFEAAWSNPSTFYTPVLCCIIDNENLRAIHEPAVELLQELADERAIATLAKAASYRWDFDPWLSLPKKALEALAAVGSPPALATVKKYMSAPEEALREHASCLLDDE